MWGRSHSGLAFSLLGYKGNVFVSQLRQPMLIGGLETSDGVRHPRTSSGTSGLTNFQQKIDEIDLLNKVQVQLATCQNVLYGHKRKKINKPNIQHEVYTGYKLILL